MGRLYKGIHKFQRSYFKKEEVYGLTRVSLKLYQSLKNQDLINYAVCLKSSMIIMDV